MMLLVYLVIFSIAATANGQSACRNPKNQVGVCIPLFNCNSLVTTLREKPLTTEKRQFLAASQCGWSGNQPTVCCIDGIPQKGGETTQKPAVSAAPTSAPSKGLLPKPGTNACGIDTSERIYGGNVTKIDEYPWLVLLEYTKPQNKKGFHCGGVLISERYVLTASHCVNSAELPTTWTLTGVRLGEWDLDTLEDCDTSGATADCNEPPQDIPVEELIPNENYEPAGEQQYNDIALLRLARPARLTYFVKPICLPTTPELRSKTNVVGEKFIVAGWGKTEKVSQSNLKLKVDVGGVDYPKCNQVYSSQRRRIVDTQICAGGDKGKDSCRGDSGGPLMATVNDGRGNHFTYLAGLVSYGPSPCGMEGWPGVYTRVASYVDWIESKIRP